MHAGSCALVNLDSMPIDDLFNSTANLPKTIRGAMPYEALALSPKEIWGHGHGSMTVDCRVAWAASATWARYMVGEAKIATISSINLTPFLKREIPEIQRYYSATGTDKRILWCTGISQMDMGGNPSDAFDDNSDDPFQDDVAKWPAALWIRYQTMFETTPYWVRDNNAVADIQSAAGAFAGAPELYRYVVRDKHIYSREQPIPAASAAGGFKIVDDATPANRKAIGQVGFRVISMGDVIYKWVRVPVGWPPYPGWLPTDANKVWPPPVNPAAVAPGTKRPVRDTYIGTVNSTYFDVADPEGYNWQPQELLYIGYDEFRYFDAAGDRVADYTFKFKFKEGGWNKFLSAAGAWVSVSSDGTSTGTKPYSTNDFNNLFAYTAA